jgi:zinc/manganese transport system permease protein
MMLDVLLFLAAPTAACFVVVGIHGYLGLHVLERRVIFVDLALAQIAALGAVIGFILGHEPGSLASFFFSLATASLGAAIFSVTRLRRERIPHEAIIGITYVLATAATILVADRAPEGAEHIKELLAGSIVWVRWPVVLRNLAIYAAIGAFHYRFRRTFILISTDPERAFEAGMRVRWWDFLFYLSFALVITLSVEIAGVLMVFAYLVAPAIIAIASSDRWGVRTVLASGVGSLASILGLLLSYWWDLPSGPAVVCTLGLFLVLYALWRGLRGLAR